MKKFLFSYFIAFLLAVNAFSQTSLSAGDLLFAGFQSGEAGNLTAKDRFAFILLKDVVAGTQLSFTDNAVLNASPLQLCTNEGFVTWTAEENMDAGSVVILSQDTTAIPGAVNGGLSFSQSGDQILAFQINGTDTIALAAFSSSDWIATCSSGCGNTLGNNSATCLPAGLQSQVNALDFPAEINNSFFSLSPISGSPEEIRALVMNPSNWIRSDSLQTWPGWSVTVVTGLEKNKAGDVLFHAFPNPCAGSLSLDITEPAEVLLFSLQGKELFHKALLPGLNRLDLSAMQNGLYLIRCGTEPFSGLLEIRK